MPRYPLTACDACSKRQGISVLPAHICMINYFEVLQALNAAIDGCYGAPPVYKKRRASPLFDMP